MTGWTRRTALAAGALGLTAGTRGHAQAAFPSRPLRMVVPYTPGGLTDTVARIVAEGLGGGLGQQVVVDNRPGANSMIGADVVAKSDPDGYTLGMVIGAHAANATLYAGRIAYDPVKDFTPVSLFGIAPLIVCSSAKAPFTDLAGFTAYAKKNPGKLNYGSSGVGSAAHLATESLKRQLGIDIVHVPFRGTGPALTALMGGDISLLLDVVSGTKGQIDAGAVRGLGLAAEARNGTLPGVPTMAEAGVPGFVFSSWTLMLAPARLPEPILARLSAESTRLAQRADFRARLEGLGIDPVGNSPAEVRAFLEGEVAKWGGVIREANIKVE